MKEILKALEQIDYSKSDYTIFEDWLDLMIYASSGKEKEYLEIVKKYKNDGEKGKRPIDYFCKAFGLLMSEMKKENKELLGNIYMEWNVNNKAAGQYFTPWHIAECMASMVGNKDAKTILDPTCGSGVMLIAGCKYNPKATFYGQDLDPTCVKMCALNLCFFNLNGFAIQGNTIAFECNTVYQTKRTYLGGAIRELEGKELEQFKKSYNKMRKSPKEKGQLTLFSNECTSY